MNALNLARTAYTAPSAPTRTMRGIEYDAFARVTRQLKAAQAGIGENFGLMARALHENRQLWSLLAADVALPENGLPGPLRAGLFYLFEFTLQHSSKVLAGDATAEVLIDINTSVMRGLRSDGGDA